MCLSLQRSSGPRYLFGLGHDRGDHLLLHLHDVRVTLHQGHARSYAAGKKKKKKGGGSEPWAEQRRAILWIADARPPCVPDRGVRLCDLHEHRAHPEDHGRRTFLHSDGCHQGLWRSHGHIHLSRERLKASSFKHSLFLLIYFSCTGQRGSWSVTLSKSRCLSQGRVERQTIIHTHRVPSSAHMHVFGLGRLQNLERTHPGTGRTSKLHKNSNSKNFICPQRSIKRHIEQQCYTRQFLFTDGVKGFCWKSIDLRAERPWTPGVLYAVRWQC